MAGDQSATASANVASEHTDYLYAKRDWQLLRDAYAGQRAIVEAGTAYVPKLSSFDDADYAAYLKRGVFPSVLSRTVSGLSGLALRKPPLTKAPSGADAWLKNANGAGRSAADTVNALLFEKLLLGRVALFVDFPALDDADGDLSVAEAAELGVQPLASIVYAEDIIRWMEDSNGRLSLVMFKEQVSHFDRHLFRARDVTRLRILFIDEDDGLYKQQVWEADTPDADATAARKDRRRYVGADPDDGGYVLKAEFTPILAGEPLTAIPFFFVGDTPDVEKSPLLDLAELSVAYYRKHCDLSYGLHLAALPTPYIIGATEEESDAIDSIGPGTIWKISNPNAKVGYAEVRGEGFAAIREDLRSIEDQMISLGARILAQRGDHSPESGVALSIRSASENAVLVDTVRDIEAAFGKALRLVERFYGVADGSVGLRMNTDFVASRLSAQEIGELTKAFVAGAISFDTLMDNLRRGEIVAQDRSTEDERELIEQDAGASLAGFEG